MASYVLAHSHDPEACDTAYAAWSGYDSPLRRKPAIASCASGGHRIFWVVEADDAEAALRQLPEWLAGRTAVSEVSEVVIP
jgi:hypothetical protein